MKKINISSVVLGRNDNYKDDKRCLIHLLSSLETFDEVIYVDWNSPKDKGSLLWKLEPYLPKTGKLKHIMIPPHIAEMFTPDPTSFKLQEPVARNLGIRRATGDWIVSTNIDIIPPSRDLLVNFIQERNSETFYTVSRREAPLSIVDKYDLENWKDLYTELVFEIGPRYFPAQVTPNDNFSLINSCGDFQIASSKIWNTIKGFEEEMYGFCFVDTNVQKKAVISGFSLIDEYNLPVFHIEHSPYQVNEDGEKEKSDTHHENSEVNKFNDAFRYVEMFEETSNGPDWGLGDTEIEIEVI